MEGGGGAQFKLKQRSSVAINLKPDERDHLHPVVKQQLVATIREAVEQLRHQESISGPNVASGGI